jgi:FlaA1/EpsC-like NDP-sugar epimerase
LRRPSLAERLLGRPSRPVAFPPPEAFEGKAVLVTGAGGFIGSALCRRLAALPLRGLILLEAAEGRLQRLRQQLAERSHAAPSTLVLGDVGDAALVDDLLGTLRPDLIVHAAAFKHVVLLEDQIVPAVRNNVLATHALVRAAARHGVARLVLLSSDKAVNPVSVMGATKRLAELIVSAAKGPTRFTALRLGNVLGSSGSVVPRLRGQLRRRQPLTVTHPDAARYFVTLPEAIAFLLNAAQLGCGGDVLVPDLGPPLRILALAERLRRLHDADVPIVFTGLHAGEKLEEDLWRAAERPEPTSVPGLLRLAACAADVEGSIAALAVAVERRDAGALLSGLQNAIPEYRPALAVAERAR